VNIATWNLDGARPSPGARTSRLLAEIAQVDAGVWILTETHPDFSPGTGYQRVAHSASAPDQAEGGCWVAIWTRMGATAEQIHLDGEPERTAAIRLDRAGSRSLLVFGTVLPWRGDTRHASHRGAGAFERALTAQSADWDAARAMNPDADLCIAGDFNQEWSANGPVGTVRGREALESALRSRNLRCVTGGADDPLATRGWRANIDHVVLSSGLRVQTDATRVWPEDPVPNRNLSDHHGICVTVLDV
jgi:hypothetical protein